ncbi:MAG: peptide chain release factor N(5)-glutamine methyltransferase [Lachnospiraceae bacterium]|nr:peptide chain release factor N(5)-glutamine methyltransferase [Lachnospiraceae bacterium]
MTYKDCYVWGVKELETADVPEAKLDARLLLETICGTDRNTLLVHGDREVLPEQIEAYEEAICKRAKRVPLQHILGQQEFMGLVFEVNEHVLIPRQDTEVLVEKTLEVLKACVAQRQMQVVGATECELQSTSESTGVKVLDMCTGSGCILISLLKMCPGTYGVGVDISKEALVVARRNAAAILECGIGDGTEKLDQIVRWIHSDMFTQVEGQFDVITSNPPYIPTKVIEGLMPEVKDFEPMNALDGMEDGLFFYRQIAEQAPKFLKSQGHLFLEIGHDQGESVSQLLTQQGFEKVEVIKDYAGLDRVVHAQK